MPSDVTSAKYNIPAPELLLDVKSLREEWNALRGDLAKIPPRQLPGTQALRDLWKEIEAEAARQNRLQHLDGFLEQPNVSHVQGHRLCVWAAQA